MGCVASRKIDKEERVQICKERKKLMKQLLLLRSQFAAAQMAYLQALKNTGVTLRQFTDSECIDVELLSSYSSFSSSCDEGASLPSSPQPLPPPPPPLPPFSPDHDGDDDDNKADNGEVEKEEKEEVVVVVLDEEEISDSGSISPVTPLPPTSPSWGIWDSLDIPSSPSKTVVQQVIEEENWAETNTEFEKETEKGKEEGERQEEKLITDIILHPLFKNSLGVDSSSMVAIPRNKEKKKKTRKTLSGIIKEIDDYFLKASASGKDVILVLDINRGVDSLYQNFGESMRKTSKSSKVFSALSWSWSSRALNSSKDSLECYEPGEPCKPGAHGMTLERIYTDEERLFKEVKGEENTKLEYGRKTLLLQRYEAGDQDLLKTEETRSSIETLQYDMCCFQQSISETNSSILKLIDEELHPQLIMLSSGLMHMWRTMCDCHQIQYQIAQQMEHLTNYTSMEPTPDYHRQFTVQLETEVNGWYNSFCNLLKSQREYVQVLNRWVQLTDWLMDGQQESNFLSIVQHLCEHWQFGMDHLPDKVAAEAIKNFLSVIHSIVLQQTDEQLLQKRSERLEKKLQREIDLLDEMEKKFGSNVIGDVVSNLSPNHPLAVKRAKIEAFKSRVGDEKTKYLTSVQLSRGMTLSNLRTSLPNVFQALTVFSSVCAQAFEAVNSHTRTAVCQNDESEVCESSLVGSA
ncbi:Nitrate regulatory gene2 protein [Thalictrum thalictroides]|uniref:Nitrate regulatory gene2 protein n=1 Tax=Thalictrum thalictroides TaxID=46969 RepID=A0A7J6V9W2_THATH|nr:Nitrate regulatory gene2 protein [Thalictrum thalictroides]